MSRHQETLQQLAQIDEETRTLFKSWAAGREAGFIYGSFIVLMLWLVQSQGCCSDFCPSPVEQKTGALSDGKKIVWFD